MWKSALLNALKFTLAVLIASSVRFLFNTEINWLVQIATAVFVFIVAMVFFYFQEKRKAKRENDLKNGI